MASIVEDKKLEIAGICKDLKIKSFYAFGSVVSENFTSSSDIDVLISFADDISIDEYSENYFQLHYKLRELFHREVDIVTAQSLSNPYFIESINKSKVVIYEA